jgi:hypothetical protein
VNADLDYLYAHHAVTENRPVLLLDRLYARVDTTDMENNLRCRATKNATAGRFEIVQCRNHATTTVEFSGIEYAVCGRHAESRTASIYKGQGWRRAC